jgi:hypothetical protein
MDLGFEANICRIRRDLQRDGHYLNRAKQALTSEKATTIVGAAITLTVVVAVAYVARRRSAYDLGLSEGLASGFIVGDFAGSLGAGAGSSRKGML